MQTLNRKIFNILITLFLLVSQQTHSQNNYILIDKADSLFLKKKFIQSNQIYDELFYKEGHYTPRMLLKMAYINEGLENYAKTLYFLNLYNTINPSKEVLEKMETIAEEYQVKGYEYDDSEYFLLQYYKYYNKIIISFLGFGFIAFIYIVLKRNLPSKIVKFRIIIVSIYLLLTIYIIDSHLFKKGVVTNSHALLVDSPSAGGNLITHVPEGTRLKIIEKNDIWYKVKWNEKTAFIREFNMSVLDH